MHINEASGAVVDAAMKVHSELGPGLFESVYRKCLAYELGRRGIAVDVEVPQPVVYDGEKLDFGFRFDMLVGGVVVV
jgi:GxxExxY protein